MSLPPFLIRFLQLCEIDKADARGRSADVIGKVQSFKIMEQKTKKLDLFLNKSKTENIPGGVPESLWRK